MPPTQIFLSSDSIPFFDNKLSNKPNNTSIYMLSSRPNNEIYNFAFFAFSHASTRYPV